MLNTLTKNWWTFLLRGAIAIVFGILALIWPAQAKLALVLLFGAYALMDGMFSVFAGIASYQLFNRWWVMVLEGVTGILVGVLTFVWPNITALALLYIIAAWAIITGIFEIVAAIQFRHVITGEWALIVSGLLSVLFGGLLFVFPAAGTVSLVWLIGIYAIGFGILMTVFAFRLHGLGRNFETTFDAIR
jgi:uncharacterized membrane protein HdeD (DUF308 family)